MQDLVTPSFILDEDEFEKNITNFYNVLNKYFKNSVIGYSFKTNSLPRLLQLAKENGCWAEVVSGDEFHLAERIGFEPNRIIFNGPIKTKEDFYSAISNKSIVNIDSRQEIVYLKERQTKEIAHIGIRVNFDLEAALPGQTSTGKLGGRFGFCYENGELHKVICELKAISNVKISGLHMHISNASKSPEVYKMIAEKACTIAREEGLLLDYIDFGGGYFGGGDNGECYEKYVIAMNSILQNYNMKDIRVIVEPGASVVATAFSYITSVKDVKQTNYGNFVVSDGSRLHIDPFMVKEQYKYSIITKSDELVDKQTICGYTCMEKDRIMTLTNKPKLEVGDKIEYSCVGSYTMCFNSLFISYLPVVYGKRAGEYVIVREKWGIEEFLNKNRWKR